MYEIHYTYSIVNNLNDKIYVGVHSTNNPDDGYMGSGTYIKRAIAKHGIENFEKIIINYHPTREEAFKEEAYMVDSEFVESDWTYNLALGGEGSVGNMWKGVTGEDSPRWGKTMSQELKEKIRKAVCKPVLHIPTGKKFNSIQEAADFFGVPHTTLNNRLRRNSKKNELKFIKNV